MSENYIMLNGKRVDLTEEQLEKLGIKVEKDCFNKEIGQECYFINGKGFTQIFTDVNGADDNLLYKVGNYCTDKSIMRQRALHETFSRLLWRFSMQNDGEKIDWSYTPSHCIAKFFIYFDNQNEHFGISTNSVSKTQGTIYFYTQEIAQRALKEIVLPFMKEHPEFVW